jgi:TonB family protein
MDLLLSVSVRALIPAALAGAVLGIARVKGAAARHAVWSLVTMGMLTSGFLAPVLSPIALRVLPAAAEQATPTEIVMSVSPAVSIAEEPRPVTFSWGPIAAMVYGAGALVSLIRLAAGYGYTRRLMSGARHLEAELYESSTIAAPMTTGWLRPKILLPLGWRDWDEARLHAVLAHERAHVRRGDWIVAAAAAVNRSVFWFHPLAWWLERKLGALAELACDDAAILATGRPADYAQVLLEMAAAVKASRGRVVREMMAMAKVAEVSVRIDRILDDARTISPGMSRRWKVALVALGLPLIYVAAVLQVAPALAQQQQTETKSQSAPATPAPAQAAPAAQPAQSAPPPARAPKPTAKPTPQDRAEAQDTPAQPLRLIHRVDPEYPQIAKQTGAKGTIEMAVTVAPDGHVSDVKVLRGHPMLQMAAKEAVKQWIYNAQPVETRTTVTVNFDGAENPPKGGGMIQQAVLISRKEPLYPQEAKRAGAHGAVVLNATIDKTGHVSAVRVVSGDPLLAQAAEDAVRQWIYRPTMLNGAAVETQTQITLNFVGSVAAPADQPGLEKAELLERREPVHPGGELANLSGVVVFRAAIGVDGKLKNIQVNDGPAELVPAALEAVKQWKYRPANLNGQPMEQQTTIQLRFTPAR